LFRSKKRLMLPIWRIRDESEKGYLSDEAKETLLGYAAQQAGDFEDMILEEVSPDQVYLNSFRMETVPVA